MKPSRKSHPPVPSQVDRPAGTQERVRAVLAARKKVDRCAVTQEDDGRCRFATSDARRCTMLRAAHHDSLCAFHAGRERQVLEADAVAADLAPISGEFRTANDINRALGKLFLLSAANRIPTRRAATLAYIGQLLLHSLHGVHYEINQAQGCAAFDQLLRRALAPPANRP